MYSITRKLQFLRLRFLEIKILRHLISDYRMDMKWKEKNLQYISYIIYLYKCKQKHRFDNFKTV